MQRPSRFVAVDSAVLLALTAGDPEGEGAVDCLISAGFHFLVPETVLHELAEVVQHEKDKVAVSHAKQALINLVNYAFIPSYLSPVEMGIAKIAAERLVREGCLSSAPLGDALVLTEAALNKCQLLLTRSESLLAARCDSLTLALVDADLFAVAPISPAEIVGFFGDSQH